MPNGHLPPPPEIDHSQPNAPVLHWLVMAAVSLNHGQEVLNHGQEELKAQLGPARELQIREQGVKQGRDIERERSNEQRKREAEERDREAGRELLEWTRRDVQVAAITLVVTALLSVFIFMLERGFG